MLKIRCLTGPALVGGLFGQSKRPQPLHVFTRRAAVGLIFDHGLRAFLGALFLFEV